MNMEVRRRTAGEAAGLSRMKRRVLMARLLRWVAAAEDEFGTGAVESGGERFGGFHPAVESDAVDLMGLGGGGKGRSGGQGFGYAALGRGQWSGIGVVSHFDVEDSMRVCGGRGISGRVRFVFRGLWGNLDW